MQPCLPKELVEIYSTPTPKRWPEPKSKDIYLVIDERCLDTLVVGLYLYRVAQLVSCLTICKKKILKYMDSRILANKVSLTDVSSLVMHP